MQTLKLWPLGAAVTLVVGCGHHHMTKASAASKAQPLSSGNVSALAEADAVAIARMAVTTNEAKYPVWLGTNVLYRARRNGEGWHVLAEIDQLGGQRFIDIDDHGAVVWYGRGK